MFGFHTPVRKNSVETNSSPDNNAMAGPSCKTPEKPVSKVRRSIGELEAKTTKTTTRAKPKSPPTKDTTIMTGEMRKTPMEKSKIKDRVAEATAWADKAKQALAASRNTKTEIKNDITQAIDKLVALVKEAASVKGQNKQDTKDEQDRPKETTNKNTSIDKELIAKLEEHARLIEENNKKMEELKGSLEKSNEEQSRQTYANIAATALRRPLPEQAALHSVVITSKNETESGEEVLNRVRKAMNAKDGEISIERVRKAKDRKIIIGCKSEEDRQKVKDRLKRADNNLTIQETKNKDPMIMLKNVLTYNDDEVILAALRSQNRNMLKDLEGKDQKMEVAYKRRTRNPHTSHIVLRVSPAVWRRLVDAGAVHIDLQRVRVVDQSPLVQCSLCLGYGHGKRFCKDKTERCSHCGGPHMRAECSDWLAGSAPTCCNCVHAKSDTVDHNAFSEDCPVRRKWEVIARATVAYC